MALTSIGRRSRRLPARQGRDPATDGIASRHRAHRRCRSDHVAVGADLRIDRGRRCGDRRSTRTFNGWQTRRIGAARRSMRREPLPLRRPTSCAHRCRARSSISTWLAAIASPSPTDSRCLAWRTSSCNGWPTALSAVRALADAEFADRSWFDEVDLADVADAAVADERRRAPDATIEIDVDTADHPRRLARRRQAGHRQHRPQRIGARSPGRWVSPASRRVDRRIYRDRRRQRPGCATGRPPTRARAIRARRRPRFGPRPGDCPAGRARARRLGDDRFEPARRYATALLLTCAWVRRYAEGVASQPGYTSS